MDREPVAEEALQAGEGPASTSRIEKAAAMSDDLTDAKIAASEARTDTKFARLEGKIDTLAASLGQSIQTLNAGIQAQRSEASANRNFLIASIIGTGVAIIGSIVAMLSYGATTFYNGTVMRDAVNSAVIEHTPSARGDASTGSADQKR